MPKVVIDFWEPIDPGGNRVNLLPAFRGIRRLRSRERMRDRGSEFTDYLVRVSTRHPQAFGMAARIRKSNLPEKANLRTGRVRPLHLLAVEGLAEEVHFLYDHPLRVLVTQRNRIFRTSALADLVHDLSGLAFDVQPKLREDAWRRFQRMARIGSLELKLHTPSHHPDLSETIPSMGTFLDEAAERVNAISVDLKLSVERVRSRSLDVGLVRTIARFFRGENNVTKMSVSGRRADADGSEIIDFLRDRLVYTGVVEYAERQLNTRQCQQLLREALETHRAYLTRLV